LGADDYGALAALLGVLTIVLLPTGALQLAVSREVSRHEALGQADEADAFGRAMLRLGLIVTVPLVALALISTVPLTGVLDIDATAAVAIVMASLAAALVVPIAIGALLGYQRFYAVAVLSVVPFALRLVIVAALALAGYRLGGAASATLLSTVATALIAIWLIRPRLARAVRSSRPALGPFLRYLWPVFVGLLGIALLTTVDLLVVRARFDPTDSGAYAAATAFARVAFFLPATILAVLFPRTAARQARGEETSDILGRSLIVTAGFGLLLALFYAMTGRGLLHTSFGGEFAEGGKYLVLLTISTTIYSLANVLVGFHLSRDERRYAWIVAAAVPVQIAVLALVPATIENLILANLVVGGLLLAAHEILVDSSVVAVIAGIRHFAVEVAHWRSRDILTEGAVVLSAAVVLVSILFWPLVVHFGSTVVGPGSDATGAVWTFWRMQHEGGYHVFGVTHHTLTGAPFGWDEGNGLNLQALLAYYPAYLAAKVVGPVAAYNLVVLSGYVLSGAAMYLLTRYLGCTRLISAWAAMVFVLFPWHLVRTPHGSLIHLESLPLLLAALVATCRQPTFVRFALVGMFTLAAWLTAGYIGAMALVATCAFAGAAALTMPWRRGATVALGSIGAALGATLFVAFLSIVSGVGRGVGLNRVASDLSQYGLRPLELVVPPAQSIVAGRWLGSFWDGRFHGSNPTEISNYLGLLTIALAAGWVVVAIRRRGMLERNLVVASIGLVATLVAAVLLALPSPVDVLGRAVPMPSRLLWEVVPAIRVPSRWVALAGTALVPLAALGLLALYRALQGHGRRQLATTAVAVAIVTSFLELAVNPARPRFRTIVPPEYVALRSTTPGIVAEYPLGLDADQLLWQRTYDRGVLGGVPEGTPGQADDARRALIDPAVPGTAEALALLGVTAVVVHPDALETVNGPTIRTNASLGAGYRLVARTPDGTSVWHVSAPAAPALVTYGGGFGNPSWSRRTGVGYPLVAPSGVATLELTARAPSVVRLAFEATPPEGPRALRLADETQELSFTLDTSTRVSALVAVPSGRSYILVKTDPPATSEADALVLAAAHATSATGDPELEAIPISADPGF
jgi:O-antigen/teichoic acid export membrane protein